MNEIIISQGLLKANCGAIYQMVHRSNHHRLPRLRRRRRRTDLGERDLPGPITIQTTADLDNRVVTRKNLTIGRINRIGITRHGRRQQRQ